VVSQASALRERAWAAAAQVADPELPALTIADLGILRAVEIVGGRVEVALTPTYSGCPALPMIAGDVARALDAAGIAHARVRFVLAPAWSSDWITPEGRAKLTANGIAPPAGSAGCVALFHRDSVDCPLCGSPDTARLAEFGATACKALYRCRACAEPFDYFKPF